MTNKHTYNHAYVKTYACTEISAYEHDLQA